MPELIDRHTLLKKVYEHPHERERMTDGEWCRKCIYEAPKVEAEPVRHGVWLNATKGVPLTEKQIASNNSFAGCCSVCRQNSGTQYTSRRFIYCPYCGAKMDGGAEDV